MLHRLLAAALLAVGLAAAAQPAERHSGTASLAASAGTRTVVFAGRIWSIKDSGGALWGPGPNVFTSDPQQVWVDEQGRLHLRIDQVGGAWRSVEVIAQDSLGYGNYRFTIETPLDALDPNVVLGLFTWSDQRAYNHREIDIEFARWGDPAAVANVQYTVQPYTTAGNQRAWWLGPGYGTTQHAFRWSSARIDFTSTAYGNTLQSWSFTRRTGIPKPGGETPRINLWLFGGKAPLDGRPAEVVISAFEFTP
jgi:hypothetical protein